MDVYEPGSTVLLADGKIPALIDCVAIYAHGGVLYQVVWWQDGIRHSDWVSEIEIQTETKKNDVGFKTNG